MHFMAYRPSKDIIRMNAHERIRGNLIPLPTPFQDDLSLDLDALRQFVRRMLGAGYRTGNGVLLAGGAGGEFASLRTRERQQVAEAVVEEAAGSIPVVVGVQDTSEARVIELTRFSQSIGADAVQIGAPYYDPPTVDDILDHLKRISDAASIPLMYYNTWWTGQNADLGYEGVARALEVANVQSLKWSSRSYWTYELVLRDFAKRLPIMDNQLCEVYSHMMGATGFVSHPPLVWPEYGIQLCKCLQEHRYDDALDWIRRFRIPYQALLHKACDYTCSEAGMDKTALKIAGCPLGPERPPARPLPLEYQQEIQQMLHQVGVPDVLTS